jgi:hypothetical protein
VVLTRVPVVLLRSETDFNQDSSVGFDAMRTNSARRYSCIDLRWSAALEANSSRTCSGMFLIVI